MADDIRETIRELLAEGYGSAEIREALRQEGYSTTVIDQVLDEELDEGGDGSRSRLWTVQQYSWIGAFLVVVVGYILLALWPLQLQSGVLPGPVSMGLTGIVGLVFGVHLLAGVYWAVKKQLFRTAVSIGGVLIAGGGMAGTGMLVQQAMTTVSGGIGLGSGTPAAAILGVAPWLLNATMLGMSVVAAMFLYDRFGRRGAVFPVLFLLVFAGIWAVQYSELSSAAATAEKPEFAADIVDDTVDRPVSLDRAAAVPPPFTKFSAAMVAIADITSAFSLWSSFYSEARERGEVDPPLTGSGEVCGGTAQNIEEQYPDQAAFVLATYETRVVEEVAAHREIAVDAFVEQCKRTEGCDTARETVQGDVDKYVQWQQDRLDAYTHLFGVTLADTPVKVDDCSPPPEQYYGVTMQDVSCTDPFTVEMTNTGTRELTSPVKVYVRNVNGTLIGAGTAGQVDGWSSDTRSISTDTLFDGLSDTDGFAEGQPYRVAVEFVETDLTVRTYCVGGNGFCENCRMEQRPAEFAGERYNRTVLVR
jgi:hypothetical protein